MLGDELVTQGLTMDMRAEDARAELEAICGGVIDVDRIRAGACADAGAKCDLIKYLEDPNNVDPNVVPLKKCLGIMARGNATLGAYPVCVWQIDGESPCASRPGVAHPEGCIAPVYPPEGRDVFAAAGPTGFRLKPGALAEIILGDQAKCANAFKAFEGTAGAAYDQSVKFIVIEDVLSLTPPIVPEEPTPDYLCTRLAKLRAGAEPFKETGKNGKVLGWTSTDLAAIAKDMKVVRDDLNNVRIHYQDVEIAKVTGVRDNPWGNQDEFPCTAHEQAAETCAGLTNPTSLLCGLGCAGPAPQSPADKTTAMARVIERQTAGERLAKAVELMRVISNAGLAGVDVAFPPALEPFDVLGDQRLYWSIKMAAPFTDSSWDLNKSRPAVRDYEGLRLRKTTSQFRAKQYCDVARYVREGFDSNVNYCVGEFRDESPGILKERGAYYGTWLHNVDERIYAGARHICINDPQGGSDDDENYPWRYPFSASDFDIPAGGLPDTWSVSTGALMLPPPCQAEEFGERVLTIVDAGELRNWPQMTGAQVSRLWTSDLAPLLRKVYESGDESARLESKGSGVLVGDPEGSRAIHLDEGSSIRFDGHNVRDYSALHNYTHRNLLDAFELACVATAPNYDEIECDTLNDTDDFKGTGDLRRMQTTLHCRGEQIARLLDTLILQDMPVPLINALSQQSLAGIAGEFGGQYAQAATRLYNGIIGMGTSYNGLQAQLRLMGTVYGETDAQVLALKAQGDIEVEAALMAMELADNDCTKSRRAIGIAAANGTAEGAAGGSGGGAIGMIVGAVAGGAGAAGLAAFDSKFACRAADITNKHHEAMRGLIERRADAQITAVLQASSGQLINIHSNMETASDGILTGFAEAQAALSELQALRNQAHAAAAKVLMLDNDAVGRQFNVNTAMRARMNTLRVRYESARQYAVRMTYLARRAIEQKLGVDLNDLRDPVGWVEAPSQWADTLCSLSGINYDEIRDSDMQEEPMSGQVGEEGYNYASEYIGDYVRRLEELITAYENTYTSGTGRDTVVVSVRDELLNVRNAQCAVPGVNELLQSERGLNVAPPELAQDAALDYVPEQIWESVCDTNGVCVEAAADTDEQNRPFICYGIDEDGSRVPAGPKERADGTEYTVLPTDCPAGAKARVRPVHLLASAGGIVGGGSGDEGPAPDSPPAVGMAYWYRADSCNLDPTAPCTDRSGRGRNSHPGAAGSANVTKVPSGIGGLPTLDFPKDSYIYTPSNPVVVTDYTLVSVFRAGEVGTNYAWQTGHTTADGRPQQTVVSYSAVSGWGIGAHEDTRANAGPYISASVNGKIAPQERPRDGDILVIRNGPAGLDLYVNGTLRAHADQRAAPSNLHGYVGYGTGGPVQVAETIAYERALPDSELQTLHHYLSGRYGLALNPVVNWFNANVVDELRKTGTSQVSGQRFNGLIARDAATGLPFVEAGALETRPMEPFFPAPANMLGLRFNYEHLSFKPLASVSGGANNVNWSSLELAAQSEYTGTSVVKLDGGGNAVHTILAMSSPLHSATATRYTYLEVDCASGAVGFLNTRLGAARMSAGSMVDCASPFVISLRGSQSAGTTDVFVNGVRVLSDPSFDKSMYHHLGGRNGRYMRGLVADMRFHIHRLSDADVASLHRELQANYEIPISVDIGVGEGTGGIAGTSPGQPTYGQWVNLARGTYVLSWFEQDLPCRWAAPCVEGALEPELVSNEGRQVLPSTHGTGVTYSESSEPYLNPGAEAVQLGWKRHWRTFELPTGGDYFVGFGVPFDPERPELEDGVRFAAPQLERVDGTQSAEPLPYFSTDDDFLSPIGVCDDQDGSIFRSSHWGVGCEYYCPASLGPECARIASNPGGLPKRCFHELKFHLSQEEIESGKLLSQAGFASGNFNYRFEDIAVNVVGTAVKDCSTSETPSACYAANFLQYTLVHDGPFLVRNYFGEDYQAPLYPGRVQQGKALLAERYLTNPLSSADNGLLQRYWDAELVGRPMSGGYTLRIYDTDGLNWEALQDVQLVMNYRYWTRAQ